MSPGEGQQLVELAVLLEVLHPHLRVQALGAGLGQAAQGLYVVFVVPLLVESSRWRQQIDRLCVVDCDQDTQIERVQSRSGLELATIQKILAAQATREQRLAVADDVIDNSKAVTMAALEKQVLVLHQGWCNLAQLALKLAP